MVKAVATIDYPFVFGGDFSVFVVNGTVAVPGENNFQAIQVGPYPIDVDPNDINNDIYDAAQSAAEITFSVVFGEGDTVNLLNPLNVF